MHPTPSEIIASEFDDPEVATNVLIHLANWMLQLKPPPRLDEGRYAPCAVTRSDGMIMGTPLRFAWRSLLCSDDPGLGFVHCRRRKRLAASIRPTWDLRKHPIPKETAEYHQLTKGHPSYVNPTKVIVGTPLADALLRLHPRFSEGGDYGQWHVITSDLGKIYGGGDISRAVLYTRAYPYSGVCAQAALYMAAVLRSDYEVPLLGMAEISALVADDDHSEIPIGWLNFTQIQSLSSKLGLNVRPELIGGDENREDSLWHAISTFIKADVPVILPINLGKFTRAKGYQHVRTKETDTDTHHALLAIGCNLGGDERTLVVLDSATVPFLRIPFSAIVESIVRIKPAGHAFSSKLSGAAQIFPVLPAAVKLCLNTTLYGEKKRTIAPGLLFLIKDRLNHGPLHDRDRKVLSVSDFENGVWQLRSRKVRGSIPYLGEGNWVYELSVGNRRWIWDAERPSHIGAEAEEFLLGSLPIPFESSPRPIQVAKQPVNSPAHQQSEAQIRAPLDASVILSLSGLGLRESLAMLPEGVIYADLYCFMAQEAEAILNASNGQSVLTAMANIAGNSHNVSESAQKIQHIIKASGKAIKFRALASFLPEIASPRDHERNEVSNALVFLRELSLALNQLGHEIRAIEITGGSRVDGVWLGKHPAKVENELLCVLESSEEVLHNRLLSAISRAVAQTSDISIPYCLEIEPGPLFIIQTPEKALQLMVSAQRQYPNLITMGHLGVNFDLAHLGILRHEPSDSIINNLLPFVKHVHISDYSPGHLADIPLGDLHDSSHFVGWIRLLRRSTADGFSRTISLELECCRHGDDVAKAVLKLNELLNLD